MFLKLEYKAVEYFNIFILVVDLKTLMSLLTIIRFRLLIYTLSDDKKTIEYNIPLN